MKILWASSEVVPFSKTGGLADVSGALPAALERLGHDVCVFTPAYRCVLEYCESNSKCSIEDAGIELEIPVGDHIVEGRLLKTRLPDTNVVVYLVDQPSFYDRPGAYGDDEGDFEDNCERYVFFCRSVLESIRLLDLGTELIHANDWQTGLIPALLKIECAKNPLYDSIASLMTIHNLAYQGSFWYENMVTAGIGWEYYNWQQMESYGNMNLLKTGLVFSDAISTVSPTYANEIQRHGQGFGLDGLLRKRSDVLTGIVNGIDVDEWNPETDSHLPANYSIATIDQGKAVCKAHIQKEFQLEESPDKPLIGIVGRLAEQKGWSLILPTMRRWLEQVDAQWIVLGTGEPDYHHVLNSLHRSHPHKLGLRLGFSNQLAHQIEAGVDMFAMPSLYEPCGLNQMYSMAYGTVPVVRHTGGLADTVIDTTPETIENGTANGFAFQTFIPRDFDHALDRAVETYQQRPDVWQQLRVNGMKSNWSWNASAVKYDRLYQDIVKRRSCVS